MTGGGRRWRLVRARTDAVPASLRRFMRGGARSRGRRTEEATDAAGGRTASRRRRRVTSWTAVAAVALLALLAGWAFWSSSLFAVREVRVTGGELLSAAEVRDAAAVSGHTPLLRVDRGAVADRVGALPAVSQVEVRRAWPDTLVVEVVERTAVAVVPGEDGYQLFDREGVGFFTVSRAPADLPTLDLSDPGPEDPATHAALVVLESLTPQLLAELDTLVVTGPAGIRLELSSGRTVVWGDETASEEKARVATALLDGAVSGGENVIDVSAPEVVVLR